MSERLDIQTAPAKDMNSLKRKTMRNHEKPMKIIVACSYFRHDNNNDGDRDDNNLNDTRFT